MVELGDSLKELILVQLGNLEQKWWKEWLVFAQNSGS